MNRILAVSMIALLVISCTPTKKDKVEEKPLMDQIMEAHDEVMPKMGALMKTRRELLAKSEAVSSSDSTLAVELNFLAQELDLANESMMDWMRNFDPEFTGTEEEVQKYLLLKKEGIQKVAEAMNSSLVKGKEALK
ncbi:MAG: hypothetical protein JXR03_08435 [Cyclobacteriaceae bacterium]